MLVMCQEVEVLTVQSAITKEMILNEQVHMSLLNWNREFALEQAAEDEELLMELIDIFKGSYSSDLQIMREGVETGDVSKVAGAAHSIKGAASSLGIEGISNLTKKIEDDAKSGSIGEAKLHLPDLEKMLEEILAIK